MGDLRIKASEYECKEKDRQLKKQFMNGITNDEIMTEIIRELTAVKESIEITSDQVLSWATRFRCKRYRRH